ncbi:MAG: hypothetical protein HYV07_17930 [Deltaproteobacteria bacterium]|nr:hypothetical protein [Deltaproteobacteria bacterium]
MNPPLEERLRKGILIVLSAAMVAYLLNRSAGDEKKTFQPALKEAPFLYAGGSTPGLALSCDDVELRGSSNDGPVIVATFKDAERAKLKLEESRAPTFSRLGALALLPLSPSLEAQLDRPIDDAPFSEGADPRLLEEARRIGAESIFVSDPGREAEVVFDLESTGASEDSVRELAEELADSFSLSFLALPAPWEPDFVVSSTHAIARRTLRRVTEVSAEAMRDASREATGSTDPARALELVRSMMETGRLRTVERLRELRARAERDPLALDPNVVDLELQFLAVTDPSDRVRAALDRRESLSRRLGSTRTATSASAALLGITEAEENTLRLGMVMLSRPIENLPGLVRWLCKRGQSGLKLAAVSLEE